MSQDYAGRKAPRPGNTRHACAEAGTGRRRRGPAGAGLHRLAVARRQWAAHDDPGGAAADSGDPRRIPYVGNRGRHPGRPAGGAVRLRCRAGLDADRAVRRAHDRRHRAGRDRARLGAAGRGARRVAALWRDHRHRLRRRRHAALAAAAGAGLAARPHRLRHGGLYQRAADRGNPPGRADAAGRVAPGRRKLAARVPGLGHSVPRHRGGHLAPCARGRRRPTPIRWCRGDGGRTGRAGCCGGSA